MLGERGNKTSAIGYKALSQRETIAGALIGTSSAILDAAFEAAFGFAFGAEPTFGFGFALAEERACFLRVACFGASAFFFNTRPERVLMGIVCFDELWLIARAVKAEWREAAREG